MSRLGGLLLAVVAAAALAGCAGRRAEPPAPPPAETPAPPPVATPPPEVTAPPPAPGVVTAPWDTAARSRDVRRAHVYPKGESELGRRLVDSLPDPGGLAPAEGPPAGAAAPVAPAPSIPAPAPNGSACWEVQLAATSDAARAERVRAEATALLGVSVRVEVAGGTHRVRAGGCLDAEAALRLVERARGEGWPEAFRTEVSR